MKVKFVVATIATLALAGSSFAQSWYNDAPEASYKSTLSHAQVVEQLHKAQANGEIVSGEMYSSEIPVFRSTMSRADVVNDLKIAQQSGGIFNGELYGQQPSMLASTHTRLEIREEAIAFAKVHHGHGVNEIYGGG